MSLFTDLRKQDRLRKIFSDEAREAAAEARRKGGGPVTDEKKLASMRQEHDRVNTKIYQSSQGKLTDEQSKDAAFHQGAKHAIDAHLNGNDAAAHERLQGQRSGWERADGGKHLAAFDQGVAHGNDRVANGTSFKNRDGSGMKPGQDRYK